MKGTLVRILSPGTMALSPNAFSHVERWWLASGSTVLVVGPGVRREWAQVYHDERLFEIGIDSFEVIDPPPDGLDELLESQKS